MRKENHDLQIGEWTEFKRDIEGYGMVIDKTQEIDRFWDTKRTSYVVTDGEGYSDPSWHSYAMWSDKYRRYVLHLDASEVF